MEGVMQRTSSQAKPLEASKCIGTGKLRSPKPPLFPKPKVFKLDSKFHKAVAVNQISTKPTTASFQGEEVISNDKIAQKTGGFNISNGEIAGQKPSTASPKPQIPPKLNALSFFKSDNVTNSAAVSAKTDVNSKFSNSTTPPLRPPRSPQKNLKTSEFDPYSIKKGLVDSAVLPKNLILSKQKSASLGRKEDLNWKIKDFINDPDTFSELCKQVENCSKHSHILRNETNFSLVTHSRKKKLQDELDLASVNVYVKNDGVSRTLKSIGASSETHSNNRGDVFCSETSSCITSFFQDQKSGETKHSEELVSSPDVPKSFLHNYVKITNLTKDSELESQTIEKTPDKNSSTQSFLHRNKDQSATPKLSKSRSLKQHNSVAASDSLDSVKDSSKIFPVDKDQTVRLGNYKKSENSPRPSSSDISSFSKRFPWFGSFGKGCKKDTDKKGRCFSQFYTSSDIVEEQAILRQKNRTKSLPDMKQARGARDENLGLKADEISKMPGTLRGSSEYPHSDSDDDKDSLNHVEITSGKDFSTLAYLKAKELMTSEEVFIDVLKLLNVDFRNFVQLKSFENKNSCIPNGEVNKILNHLFQLQSLNEDILEDLRKRIENWENNPKIADVIVKKGAFLKMYTTYIQNFESQTDYLDECIIKYPKFGRVVREFEATDRCKKLSLKHYMLKPVQRIPQYRLLLNDYLKYLQETSPDYNDTLSALKIVCDVVDHANRNVTHGDKEGRLMHFQSLLSDYVLIKPGRELIKDGPLEKICRKSVKDRYFILLNDCLLHTTYSKQYLKIHQELPLSGMKICYNDDQKYPTSFAVHSITRSFILCVKSESECKEWVETLHKTIEEHVKKQKTFLKVRIEEDTSFKLGKEAPVWVQDGKVTMCQICTAEFTALFRRHHCRGCGKVVCRNCGSNQAPLQYRNFKPDRVCDQCFDLLLKDYEKSEDNVCEILKEVLNLNEDGAQNEYLTIKAKFIKYTSASNWKKQKYIPPRLKEVSANDSQSVISGWLYRKSRKSWKMFWYVLKDHVLYVYKASEDVLALNTIPVLGYEVEHANVNYEDVSKNLIFSLVHPHQEPIVFRAETEDAAHRWFDALSTATNFDYLTL